MGLKMKSGAYVGTKGSIESVIEFPTRKDALSADYKTPPSVSERIKNYFQHSVKNHYKDFKIAKTNTGDYICASYNPGKVKDSYAVYIKIISPRGDTKLVYKDSYDNKGKFVHRKFKYRKEVAE